ncbi:hypothetical protein RDI58_024517 [Solanum bulbocastanum]|uniref:Uncharacterized protein n=1 Tax=Solanum bulbocastanum TaxID=147425 RepID=A0AAN8T1F1_SOLBU
MVLNSILKNAPNIKKLTIVEFG